MNNRDLTKGKIINGLLYMSIPAMIGMMSHTIYDLVDMMWIGRLSASAVAAITLFSSIYYIVFVLNNIIGSGSVAVLSQAFGSKDEKLAKTAIINTFSFKLVVGIIAAIFLFLTINPLLKLFTEDASLIENALAYGKIRILFLPISFSSFTVITILRCSGDSKSPMIINILTSVLNIVLDPIFIFNEIPLIGVKGLGFGVAGAAIATVIATTTSFIISSYIMFGPKSKYKLKLSDLFKIDKQIVGKITKIGLPEATSGLIQNLAHLIMVGFVTIYGTLAIAAWGIMSRLFNLLFMPLSGLTQGGSAMVGQNIGAAKMNRAEDVGLAATKLGFFVMLIIAGVSFIFMPQIMRVFTTNEQVIKLGAQGLRAAIICMPIFAAGFGLSTLFGGSGYTVPFLYAAVIGQWVIQIPLMFLVARVLNLSFPWLTSTYIFYAIGQTLVSIYFYKKGKWRKKALADIEVGKATQELAVEVD
ncbi:MAG: MATE family efflux transporter [Clostridia bacterium]